eukprot:19359-Eustigmatos_ZCMA.PRE.1
MAIAHLMAVADCLNSVHALPGKHDTAPDDLNLSTGGNVSRRPSCNDLVNFAPERMAGRSPASDLELRIDSVEMEEDED